MACRECFNSTNFPPGPPPEPSGPCIKPPEVLTECSKGGQNDICLASDAGKSLQGVTDEQCKPCLGPDGQDFWPCLKLRNGTDLCKLESKPPPPLLTQTRESIYHPKMIKQSKLFSIPSKSVNYNRNYSIHPKNRLFGPLMNNNINKSKVQQIKSISKVTFRNQTECEPCIPNGRINLGVNLSSADLGGGSLPGCYGSAYTYPKKEEFDYYQKMNLKLIRLPFLWERVQWDAKAALNEIEITRIKIVLHLAKDRGMLVILDVHNYGRYYGDAIETEEDRSNFADLWFKLATTFKPYASVIYGYGLCNEPHDLPGNERGWVLAAQEAITAIRVVDQQTSILVGGYNWSGAWHWPADNPTIHTLIDPNNNLIFEAHLYCDVNNTGQYLLSYNEQAQLEGENKATPMIGINRLQPFADWLKLHSFRGFLGEFNVPRNLETNSVDPQWMVVLNNLLQAMLVNKIPGTAWASGPWYQNYILGLNPRPPKRELALADEEPWPIGPDAPIGPTMPQTHLLSEWSENFANMYSDVEPCSEDNCDFTTHKCLNNQCVPLTCEDFCQPPNTCIDNMCTPPIIPPICDSTNCDFTTHKCLDNQCIPLTCEDVCRLPNTCINNICTPPTIPPMCDSTNCNFTTHKCLNNQCVPKTCEDICQPPNRCNENGRCVPETILDPCLGKICGDDERCVNGVCLPIKGLSSIFNTTVTTFIFLFIAISLLIIFIIILISKL